MTLPPDTRLHPGHSEPTTVGDELEPNPFVRVWRGLDPEGDEPCKVRGAAATLVLWAPDYDGAHKAWVRFPDGRRRDRRRLPGHALGRGALAAAGVGPRGVDELAVRGEEALVVRPHHLVVPLQPHGPAAAVLALDGLDHAVAGAHRRLHDGAGGGDALVVERVDARRAALQPARRRGAGLGDDLVPVLARRLQREVRATCRCACARPGAACARPA